MDNDSKKSRSSVFYRWFLNNKFTIGLLNVLLIILIIFSFNKIGHVFDPLMAFLWAIVPIILFAAVQYYLMDPVVNFMENRLHIKRSIGIMILFVVVLALLIWIIVTLIPILQDQINQMIKNWPTYWDSARKTVNHWLNDPRLNGIEAAVENYSDQIQKYLVSTGNGFLNDTVNHLGVAVNVISVILVVVLTAPVVLYYMLSDGRRIKQTIAYFFPDRYRDSIMGVMSEINTSISSYIRGQMIVAFWVGVMFAIGYSIVGQNYAITLAVVAAILNLIPYFGTFIAFIPSLIIAMFDSTGMLIKVLIVFAIEQTIESKVISPQVMGNKLDMHPVTTILVLIGAGAAFGLWGVVFGIPVYAILKIIFQHVFNIYRVKSGLYTEELALEDQQAKEAAAAQEAAKAKKKKFF